MYKRTTNRLFLFLIPVTLLSSSAFGITTTHKTKHRRRAGAATASPAAPLASNLVRSRRSVSHLSRLPKKRLVFSPWDVPTFADSTEGDSVDGEDLVVRRAAVQALGPYNGTVVVADPMTGRLLTIVNQKLAYQSGFQPCSTIKIVAALAGLSEGILKEETHFRLAGRRSMDLTEALAHSNNAFFSSVGFKLGYNRIVQYAELFGLGEKAGLNLDAEQPGTIASEPPKDGIGMMTSFGEGIYMTPMELAALVSAVANGGTLYYLQHPRSPEDIAQFAPRVKRSLDIAKWVPDIRPGMMGAVEYGTARRANFDPNEPIFGKTGTCTDGRSPTHLGWFGSYNETGGRKLVVVVLLTGGRPVSGPVASGVAGAVYKNLSQENYFAQTRPVAPIALISTQSCCASR
ncbi:MAG TPA: penicillin-binding transpeptidase domain-containing protein [Bryobacteraceae bacterium]|nr:penicillin-binding transpeptidase domain-containing protein [Bryobacteraceae bacterium]